MKILALSAANILHQPEGTSVRLAKLALAELHEHIPDLQTELVTLVDKRVEPCIGCGGCAYSHRCSMFADDFTLVYDKLLQADGLILVTAHYAPIPAKLCALFERIESISFLGWHNDSAFPRPLLNKPYAVIGHCGGPPTIWRTYYDVIFTPIKNALGFPVSMQPIDTGQEPRIGCMLGPSRVEKNPASVFPVQIYDDELIRQEIRHVIACLADTLLGR